jgi:hypothetical protein
MIKRDAEGDFRVGYGKPPRNRRFAPGISGNPRGRQKGVGNLASDVKHTLEVPVRLTEQGKPKRVSTQQAVLLRLREKALKGDAHALDRLLALAASFNNVAEIGSARDQASSAEDQAILDAYREEILERAGYRDCELIANENKPGNGEYSSNE